MMKKKKFGRATIKHILFLGLSFFLFESVFARIGKPEEAPVRVLLNKEDLKIKKDGSSVSMEEKHSLAQTKEGIKKLSLYELYIDPKSEEIPLVEIEVATKGQTKKYDLSMMKVEKNTVKPKNKGVGFDHYSINLPDIEIGTTVTVKKTHRKKYYFDPTSYSFGLIFLDENYEFVEKREHSIESDIPFYYRINSPGKLPKKEDRIGPVKKLHYKNTFSDGRVLIDEPEDDKNYILGYRHQFRMPVSNFKNWREYGSMDTPFYEKKLQEEMPKPLKEIVDAAKKINDPVDQIDFVVREISKIIIEHQSILSRQPFSLSELVLRKKADCKSYGFLAVALLRKLGFKAWPFLISRPVRFNRLLYPEGVINHVMAKVVDKNNKVHWIEPQTPIYLGYKNKNTFDTDVLILEKGNERIERIPTINPEDAKVNIERRFLDKNDKIIETVKVKFYGLEAQTFYDYSFNKGKENFCETFQEKFIHFKDSVLQKYSCSTNGLDRKNGGVLELNIEMEFDKYHMDLSIYPYDTHVLEIFDKVSKIKEDTISDFFLEHPRIIEEKATFEGIKFKNFKEGLDKISSKWIDSETTYKSTPKTKTIERKYVVKEPMIYSEEYKSDSFKKLKEYLGKTSLRAVGAEFVPPKKFLRKDYFKRCGIASRHMFRNSFNLKI